MCSGRHRYRSDCKRGHFHDSTRSSSLRPEENSFSHLKVVSVALVEAWKLRSYLNTRNLAGGKREWVDLIPFQGHCSGQFLMETDCFVHFCYLLPLANMQKYGAALGRKTFPAENILKQRRQTRDEIGLVYFTTPSTLDFEQKKKYQSK